jgi:hypothetical protein
VYVDATFGGGGHTRAILQSEPTCSVIAIDWDQEAFLAHEQQFKDEFGEELAIDAGKLVKKNGNICQSIMSFGGSKFDSTGKIVWKDIHIVAFPTKHHWKNPSDLELIKKSAKELMDLINKNGWTKVYLPRPGTGLGNLEWDVVKAELEKILDDRVIITYL